MCIDIVESWFGIANWQVWSIFTELSARHMIVVEYYCSCFYFLFIAAENQKVHPQVKEHRESVLNLIQVYLKGM